MKTTHLKLLLTMAVVVGIASIDSTAATKISSINIDPTIIAATLPSIAVECPIIGNDVIVEDIDIQASLPIIS
jgi:hypothetical protein